MVLSSELIIGLATLLILNESSPFFRDQAVWEPCPPKLRKVKLVDGTMGKNDLMRRKVKGRWEYRKMTEQEVTQTMLDFDLPD